MMHSLFLSRLKSMHSFLVARFCLLLPRCLILLVKSHLLCFKKNASFKTCVTRLVMGWKTACWLVNSFWKVAFTRLNLILDVVFLIFSNNHIRIFCKNTSKISFDERTECNDWFYKGKSEKIQLFRNLKCFLMIPLFSNPYGGKFYGFPFLKS